MEGAVEGTAPVDGSPDGIDNGVDGDPGSEEIAEGADDLETVGALDDAGFDENGVDDVDEHNDA